MDHPKLGIRNLQLLEKLNIRKIFTIVLLVLMLFNSFSPLISLVSASPQPKPTTTPYTEFERVDLRTPTSKTFQTAPNKFRLETYTTKIHYGTKGNFKDINNNLEQISDPNSKYKYKNIANDYQFFAGANLAAGVKFIDARGVCEFKLDQIPGIILNNSPANIRGNIVTYPNIYPGADLVFTAESSSLTTNVVVKDKKDLKPQLNFELSNCSESVFSSPTVSDDLKTVKIPQRITKNLNGQKNLSLSPDYSKLGNIKGDIHIDPTIQTYIGPVVDVFSSDYCPGSNRRFLAFGNFYDTTISVDCGRTESYLKFDLSSLNGDIITSANLSVQRYATSYGSFTARTARLTQDIDGNTGFNTQDWKGKAEEYGTQPIDWNQLDFHNFQFDLTSLVQAWTQGTYPNYGVAIFANAPGYRVGAAVCSTRNDPLCTSNHNPSLIVNYASNQPPYIPNLVSPNNSQTFSGNCNQSVLPQTGICNTSLPVNLQISGVGDGDPSPGNLKATDLHFSGANNFVANLGGSSGNLSYNGNFTDGQTSWFARSIDGLNASSDSVSFNFKSDTTPPVVPTNPGLPAYTKGVITSSNPQVTISPPATTDNLSSPANISYQLQYSTVADFSDVTKIYTKPWQLGNPLFQIGPYGADGIQGTPDDLVDQGTYYFRLNAKDELNNISNWSNITSTTVLTTLPVVNSFSSSLNRISPNNPTSTGFKSTDFKLSYTEKYPQTANLEIRDLANNLVNTLSQDITGNQGITTPVNLSFNWTGTDSLNNYLSDGPYTITAKVYDKAGNINTIMPTQIVIVDNSGANISLSAPSFNYWTNQTNFNITGQVKSPAVPTKQDQDFSKLEIERVDLGIWQQIVPDPLGIFSSSQALNPGLNQFSLRSTDTVNNQVSQIYDPAISSYRPLWQINQDKIAPVISNVLPSSLIKNKRPTISFNLTDPDPIGDRSQTSDLPSGVLPPGLKLSLSYNIFDTTKPLPYPTITKTLTLANNGLNPNPSLVNNLTCIKTATAITSIKNNLPSASSLNCSLSFLSDLSPDDNYTINITASDNAGNVTTDQATSFTLDSFNYSILTSPLQAGIYSNSSVTFKGTAAKDSTLTLTNTTLAQSRSFSLNQALNGTGQDSFLTSNFIVTCNQFVPVTNGGNLIPEQEVCSWQVNVLQKYAASNINTLNTNIISDVDQAGNLISITRDLSLNLFAFNLSVQSDLTYFSPNGDGNQDSVNFSASATNPQDPANPPNISTWELRIRDTNTTIVKLFTGTGYLPSTIFFDGRITVNGQNIWLPDGAYTYELYVKTQDNAVLLTNPKPLIAKTVLTNQVVITTPNDNFVTTEGIINVQGQAPKAQALNGQPTSLRGNITVTICDQTVGINAACDLSQDVQADQNGFFTTLMILPSIPNQSQVQHKLTAKAKDIFGNQTPNSNTVNVLLDTIDPFTSATTTNPCKGWSNSC